MDGVGINKQRTDASARLADVARAAGVSVATASRALSRPDMVAAATRARVERAAKELSFHHHPSARALITGRMGLFALCVPTLANPFFAPIISGAQRSAEDAGSGLLVVVTEASIEREQRTMARLQNQVDGFIGLATSGQATELVRASAPKPLVLVNRRARGVGSVVVDTPDGAGKLADHLTSLGHRKVAYLSGPPGSWMDPRRRRRLTARVKAAGGEVFIIGPLPLTYAAGSGAAEAVISSGATAVVAYNSVLLVGLYQALSAMKLRVPEDISLACVDDLGSIGLSMPQVTAVHVPAEEAGRLAVGELIRLGGGAQPREITLPVRLELGQSTAGSLAAPS